MNILKAVSFRLFFIKYSLWFKIKILLVDVNLNYKTDNNLIKVLQDINLEVQLKETLSIVGESGSGKTSLIMLIGGLEKATSGNIFFENDDISKVHTNEIGDIAISYEYAAREAEEQKKTFHDHVMHLTLHGILHLLGYDHQLESDAEYMELKEVNILSKFNIINPYKYE